MKPRPIPFTPAGHKELQAEHADLLNKRTQAVQELQEARDLGDRSENGYYKAARAKLSALDRRLRSVKRILQNAVVVNKRTDTLIDIGAQVTLEVDGTTVTYQMVSSQESNIQKGKISFSSPLGRALKDKTIGNAFHYTVPIGEKHGVVRNVEYI